jgi:outer membrane protein OmpA-like peptidoglycan-associated protein
VCAHGDGLAWSASDVVQREDSTGLHSADRQEDTMPNAHRLVLVASIALTFAACSDNDPPRQAQVAAPEPVAAPLPPRPTPRELFADAVVDIGGMRTNDVLKITLGGDRFGAGQGTFQPGEKIDAIATLLKNHPDARVLVEGFTDSRGSTAVNQRLSAERAAAVKRALEERGIDGARIDTAGRGSAQAVASNDTPEGRAENRRVELTFVPDGADRLASAGSATPGG